MTVSGHRESDDGKPAYACIRKIFSTSIFRSCLPGIFFIDYWNDQSYITDMSIGRPLEFDPSEALQDAMRVFRSRGYEASSLQDLLKATGLSKSSLYQTFGSKQALFDDCLEFYCNDVISKMREKLENSASGREFIESVFNDIASGSGKEEAKMGCLLMNSVSEFGQRDQDIARAMNRQIKRIEQVFADAIARDQAVNSINNRADAKSLATYFVTNMSGLRTMAKAGLSAKRTKETIKNIMRILD